jgi:hypothetical protein
MKTKILITAFLIGSIVAAAQTFNERKLEPFSKIQISGAAKIYYTTSDTLKLKITGTDKEVENTESKVEGGTLFIQTKGKYQSPVSIYIQNRELTELSCSGASDFRSSNEIRSDSLLLSVSGSSSINAKVNSKKLVISESGASNVTLSGSVDQLVAVVSGASGLKAYGLESKSANLITSGASSVKVFVSEKLVANATGASNIKVKGDLKDITAEATTAASITRIVDSKAAAEAAGDSTTFKWKGKKVIIIDGDEKKEEKPKSFSNNDFDHWAGFSIGVNGLLTPDATLKLPKEYNYLDLNYSRSINFQLNFFQHNFHLYKDYINLVTGFGIEWRRYMLENNTTLRHDSSFTWGTIDASNEFKYNKNLFKSTLIQVPLLLEFNTSKNSNKSVHLAMGVVGQFIVNSKTKQKLEGGGYTFTKINKDSYNMSVLNLKLHASLGFSKFTVFGEYNITPLFDKGEGPQLYPFVAGVRLISF